MTSAQLEIQQLTPFLNTYAGLERSLVGFRIRKDKSELQQFLNGFSSIDRLVQLQQRSVAKFYNLFEILRICSLEAKVHTPFLADLLSSAGNHRQGDLFYRAFIETVLPETDWQHYLATDHLLIIPEEGKTDGLGRIDISMHCYHHTNPFAIVIENKINAGDQTLQLARYYEFASRIRGLPNKHIRLIYLTKYCIKPSERSLSLKVQEELTAEGVLHCIGYRQHITRWLSNVLPQIEAPVVRETVSQYLKTLKTL